MKKKHIYVLIAFIILTVAITGILKITEQANIKKYIVTEEKIEKYQEQLRNILTNPSDALIQEMTESYKVAAQKDYEEKINNQMPIINIILISACISVVTCAMAEFIIYSIEKRKKSNSKN